MYVHIHVRVRQLSPQFELLNCVEFRPAGFSLARVRFDFSKVSNMEFTSRWWVEEVSYHRQVGSGAVATG